SLFSYGRMHQEDPNITVIVHTIDQKEIKWNYDQVVKAFPEIVDKNDSKFDGYNGNLHIEVALNSLTVNYLGEIFFQHKSKEINFHAIDVCLRDLANHIEWRRIVRELISRSIISLNFNNCISIWRLAKKFDHYQTRKLERYITYNLVERIARQSVDFFRLSIDDLIYFISSDTLHIQSEDDVINLIDIYIRSNENNRSHLYPLLFSHVRLRFIHQPNLSLVTRQLLDSNGSVGMRQRIHRDVFLLIGGTIDGKYQPHPAYFDHVSFSWKELQMMQLPAPFVYHAVIVLNGIVYVFGGGDTQEAYSKKMWRFENGNWKRCADMNDKRANMGNMVVTYNKKIYVMGGNQHFVSRLSSVECYDPLQDTWIQLPDMPHSRADGAACVLGDMIYVSGGLSSNKVLSEIDVYLPKEREWRTAGKLPRELSGHSMISQDGPSGASLFIFGGYTGKERVTSVYKRQMTEGKWTEQPGMITARCSASVMQFHLNSIVVFGGNNGKGAYAEKWNGESWEIFNNGNIDREGSKVIHVPDFFHEIHEY
ncbi:spe-26, partial [Pristionchus pacificus]